MYTYIKSIYTEVGPIKRDILLLIFIYILYTIQKYIYVYCYPNIAMMDLEKNEAAKRFPKTFRDILFRCENI